ncbi:MULTISPECIES: hypothetical protein [Geobacter]|uniref:Uncharacterized protein n=2 Tax=Geobacter TaxID=28231 RepID=A0A0C1TQY1_9BACT|nr:MULTISPECIES: hypothetical protein [Geobacter]ANA41061.1 hypothetical protein A2G06_13200 [Geobacter anodireducens]KIE43179.1 hypothetical protein SE37_11310 [Geobacter soli]MBE2888197.1 hypothetical protein [Geobacter anodireducens]HMN03319.1 hypothetical protein [Geobacter anodireducens]
MTHIETSRVNELLAGYMAVIKEFADRLDVNGELQEIEANVAEIEQALADLKEALASIPHRQG